MSLRSNYAIEDLVLFSARVYDRMFELHNAALWPLHIAAIAIGLYLVFVVLRPSPLRVRLALALLSGVFLFIAVGFFHLRYATINWAAVYVVPLFMLTAVILGLGAAWAQQPAIAMLPVLARPVAVCVLMFALVGYPLMAVAGTSWTAAQLFAIAADPTVAAALGFLAVCRVPGVGLAMVVPVLWSAVTALTLYGLGSATFFVAPAVAVVCIGLRVAVLRSSGSA